MSQNEISDDQYGLAGILDDLARLERRRMASFLEPRFTLSSITSDLGIPEVTVRNWLTRNQIDLGASEGRERGKWRLFSVRDVLVIALCFHLSRVGVPVSVFSTVYRPFIECAQAMMTSVMGMVRRPVGLLSNDGEWTFTTSYDSGPFRITDASGSPVVIVIDFEQIILSTIERLGMEAKVVTASGVQED